MTSVSRSTSAWEPFHGLRNLIGKHEDAVGAIIAPGVSIENADLGFIQKLDTSPVITIGLNQAVQIYPVDYVVMCDMVAFNRAWRYIIKKTHVVLPMKIWDSIEKVPPYDPKTSRNALEHLRQCDGVTKAWFQHTSRHPDSEVLFHVTGVLTSGLSLACALGLKKLYLIGVDMFRLRDKEYAYDILPAKNEELSSLTREGLFSSPSYDVMLYALWQNAAAWNDVEVINLSRYSELSIFPIDDELALPPKGMHSWPLS